MNGWAEVMSILLTDSAVLVDKSSLEGLESFAHIAHMESKYQICDSFRKFSNKLCPYTLTHGW